MALSGSDRLRQANVKEGSDDEFLLKSLLGIGETVDFVVA